MSAITTITHFILRYWYNISGIVGTACLLLLVKNWNNPRYTYVQRLLFFNFAVINFHFLEEFGVPGGFPKFANTIFNPRKDNQHPDRYPLNQLSALIINWLTGLVMYLVPVLYPTGRMVWLGLSSMLFGGVAQLLVHGIVNNVLLHTWYNSGLASVLLGHVPALVLYIRHISAKKEASVGVWLAAIAFIFVWYIGIIRIVIPMLFEDRNSPFPFDSVEMQRFDNFYLSK